MLSLRSMSLAIVVFFWPKSPLQALMLASRLLKRTTSTVLDDMRVLEPEILALFRHAHLFSTYDSNLVCNKALRNSFQKSRAWALLTLDDEANPIQPSARTKKTLPLPFPACLHYPFSQILFCHPKLPPLPHFNPQQSFLPHFLSRHLPSYATAPFFSAPYLCSLV